MNKRMLVAVIGAVASGIASAQSNVELYGLLDVGIDHITNANATGGSITRVANGGSNNSRFGFRDTEDLGGGLKAVINLEGGILADTGASNGVLFKRQSNVGLDGSFGRIVIGRSFTTVYDFVGSYDPMGYAPEFAWALTGNGTMSSKYGMTTAFDNMVKYEKKFGGFKVGASYGAGEVAGNEADGRKFAGAAAYETGPLRFVVTGERVNGTSNAAGARSVARVYHAAAAYQLIDQLSLKMGYRNYEFAPASGSEVRADTWWTGANYQLTPVIGLTAALYYENIKAGATSKETGSDPLMLVFRAKYALSKRTFLYATVAHAKAKNGVPVGLTRDSTTDGGVTGFADHQSGTIVGIQHRF